MGNISKLYTKQEGLNRVAADLAEEHGIEPNPIESGTKWKAALGIFRMPMLNGPAAAVAACLIDYADEETGIAWCSEPTIARWTGRALRTVQRGVADLKRLRLVCITRRHNASSIYSVQWGPFLSAFHRPARSGGTPTARSGGTVPPEVAYYPSYLSSLNNLVVQAAENAASTTLSEEEKRGIQKEIGDFIAKHIPPSKRKDT
jgi:hypothetical protein